MKKIQKKYRELSAEEQVRIIARVANDQKALDVVALDVRGLASFADFFVIMGGTSTRHVQGLADVIDREISSKRVRATETEGLSEGHWILLDYGDLIVHIFYHETRPDYDLEGLWHDAPRLDLSKPAPVVKEAVAKKPKRKAVSWTPDKVLEQSVEDMAPRAVKVKKATAKAVAKAPVKPARKTAAKPARQTTAKPARKTSAKPAVKGAEKPVRRTTEKPAGKMAAKPARKSAEKPARWTADKPARKTVSKPVKRTTAAKPKGKPAGRIKK